MQTLYLISTLPHSPHSLSSTTHRNILMCKGQGSHCFPHPVPAAACSQVPPYSRQAWPPTSSPRYIPKDQHPQILNLPPLLPSSLSPGSLGPSIHWRVPTPPAWQAPTPVRGSPRPVTVTLTLLQFTSLLPEHPVPLLSPCLSSQGLSSSCPMAPSAHTPAALLASEVGGGGQGGCRRHGLASGVWGLSPFCAGPSALRW